MLNNGQWYTGQLFWQLLRKIHYVPRPHGQYNLSKSCIFNQTVWLPVHVNGHLIASGIPFHQEVRASSKWPNASFIALCHSTNIILQLNVSTMLCFSTMLTSWISSQISGDISMFCGTACTTFLEKCTAQCLCVCDWATRRRESHSSPHTGAQRLIFWQLHWFCFDKFLSEFGLHVCSDSCIDFLIMYQLIYICQLPKQTNEIWPKSPWCKRNCY